MKRLSSILVRVKDVTRTTPNKRETRHSKWASLAATIAAAYAITVSPAHATLGSFENADGYVGRAITQGLVPGAIYPEPNWAPDVSTYNAGQAGSPPTAIPQNTGLWRMISGDPTVPGNHTMAFDGVGDIHTPPPGSVGVNVFTMASFGGLDTIYSYSLDETDLGGIAPGEALNSLAVSYSIRWSSVGTAVPADSMPHLLSSFSLRSGTDEILTLGWQRTTTTSPIGEGPVHDDRLVVTDGAGTVVSQFQIAPSAWEDVGLTLDFASDTYSIVFGGLTVGSGLNFGTAVNSVDGVVFSAIGTQGAIPGKTDYDDFAFSATPVPEPASVLLLGASLVGMGLIRRRKSARS